MQYSLDDLLWAALEAFDALPYTVPVRCIVEDQRTDRSQIGKPLMLSSSKDELVKFITVGEEEACRQGFNPIELKLIFGSGWIEAAFPQTAQSRIFPDPA